MGQVAGQAWNERGQAVTLDAIKAGLRDRALDVAMHLYPQGKRDGREWKIGDVSGNAGSSLSLCVEGLKAGVWKDFSTGEGEHCTLLDLWAMHGGFHGTEGWVARAGEECAAWLGGTFEKRLPDGAAKSAGTNGSHPPPSPRHTNRLRAMPPQVQVPSYADEWAKCVGALTDTALASLCEQRGFSAEFGEWLRQQGLIGLHETRHGLALALPVHDEHGAVIAAHVRNRQKNADGTPIEPVPPRWQYRYHGDQSPGTRPLIIGDIAKATRLYVFESQWDAFAVLDRLGLHRGEAEWPPIAFFITRGASNAALLTPHIREGLALVLWPQNDQPTESGKVPAEEWVKGIVTLAGNVPVRRVATPAEFEDANDWLRRDPTVDAARLLVAVATATFLTEEPLPDRLSRAAFNFSVVIPRPAPIFLLADHTIATAGNLVGIAAQAKAGKSAFVGAMLAATLGGDGDTLGVRSTNHFGRAVLHFDLEQSKYHHDAMIRRAIGRVSKFAPPNWLLSYWLTGWKLADRLAAIRLALRMSADKFHGVHSLIIDGLADICVDPNDSAEAFGLIDDLHQLAIEFDTVLTCVIHENPGSETGKTRGHLGSQLERKAETNLRLIKDADGTTVVFSERSREAHIPKEHGIQFAWNNEAKMHTSATIPGTDFRTEQKRERLAEVVRAAFADTEPGGLTWAAIHAKIKLVEGCSVATSRRRFDDCLLFGLIKKANERYWQKC